MSVNVTDLPPEFWTGFYGAIGALSALTIFAAGVVPFYFGGRIAFAEITYRAAKWREKREVTDNFVRFVFEHHPVYPDRVAGKPKERDKLVHDALATGLVEWGTDEKGGRFLSPTAALLKREVERRA